MGLVSFLILNLFNEMDIIGCDIAGGVLSEIVFVIVLHK